MDSHIHRALNDKLYDKRKAGALELERVVRELVAARDSVKIQAIIEQLCNEFAYAVHQSHARNGGLIGLAAAAIALGPELPRHLAEIVPPVLACFTDQDARVRYYACEAMYNIAKVAKGEILVYFNYIFDALCKVHGLLPPLPTYTLALYLPFPTAIELAADHTKLGADSELSVKNGAELLDRLIKDIVSESAASYISILQPIPSPSKEDFNEDGQDPHLLPTAFSLPRFIPLLQERIWVLNPFTRQFLVGWITLLDSIPDLELVTYLPEFLGGLLKFLTRSNDDVQISTQTCLDRFLNEIKRISRLKKGVAESKKSKEGGKRKREESLDSASIHTGLEEGDEVDSEFDAASDDDWIPGQDVHINYRAILEILTASLDSPLEEDSLLESLRWIVEFLDICPEEVLLFTPKILSHMLPAMASGVESIRQAAARVNTCLMDHVVSLSDEPELGSAPLPRPLSTGDRPDDSASGRASLTSTREQEAPVPASNNQLAPVIPPAEPQAALDYAAAVISLTLLFLNDHEATRVAALTWLIMLHRKAPRKVLAFNDGTFPALLKTLSDPSDAVVTKDLQLLSQLSRNREDDYFSNFMINLLQIFSTDRKLLEIRGNLIIRQLCVNLSAERIYRTLADCIEKEEDVEFASIMVQNLNNNLITAPQLSELRKKLRNLESKDGQALFVALFRSWCYNAVATFSLCLLAQAYEQAYNLLQILFVFPKRVIYAEFDMTVNLLIQIDKLVQLIESPVFTYLRLQLLEPEKYPHLYRCLYGLLMLLPQSSAFAALKNRLNSISSIGYLHIAPRTYVSCSDVCAPHRNPGNVSEAVSLLRPGSQRKSVTETHIVPHSTASTSIGTNFDRPNRLKGREDGTIRWTELLDKFRAVQERARRSQRLPGDLEENGNGGVGSLRINEVATVKESKETRAQPVSLLPPREILPPQAAVAKRSGLGRQLGRLGGAVAGKGKRL